jgi:hypothetical protein
MTGLARKATLLGVLGLFAASVALANVPDPSKSSVPTRIFVVGKVSGGASPDPVGLATINVRDFSNNPILGALVTLNFSGCCDINLCSTGVGHNCGARTVSGLTDVNGNYTFTVLGAAKDPGNLVPPAFYGGCGSNGVTIIANAGSGDVTLGSTTAITLDINGAAGGSNGTGVTDVSAVLIHFGAYSLVGAPAYKGRADIQFDSVIGVTDVSAELGHFGRLTLAGGVGCDGAFCVKPACP